jgi:uncharacterized membrane protein
MHKELESRLLSLELARPMLQKSCLSGGISACFALYLNLQTGSAICMELKTAQSAFNKN